LSGQLSTLQMETISTSLSMIEKHLLNAHMDISNHKYLFTWEIRDYTFYENRGEFIVSPKFYTGLSSHCCYLSMDWMGGNKNNNNDNRALSVYIHVCKGMHSELVSSPLLHKVTFRSTDKYGKSRSRTLDTNDDTSLVKIKPGDDASCGVGSTGFMRYPRLTDFIINDMLTITCELR